MLSTPSSTPGGEGSKEMEDFVENKKEEINEDLTGPKYLSGEYFLDKIGVNEDQMKDKIAEINNVEDEIIKIDREKLEEIIGKEKVNNTSWEEFQSFQKALQRGKGEVEKRIKEGKLSELIAGHNLELFQKKNSEEYFSLVSLASGFLFSRLIDIKRDLKGRLKEYNDDYLLLRRHKITLGKIGPKALDFLLSDKLSVENVIQKFWKFKEKSKEKFEGDIKYGFIERSMARVRKEELDERIVDKIEITEIADEKLHDILKKTYIYKTLFPHFCNHAPGSFQKSLLGMPEGFKKETNSGNPTGFFIKNESNSQLFYFKIDQGKKSALNLKTRELGGINDFDNLLMRQISQALNKTLGEENKFNYKNLDDKKIENIQENQFKDYCKIEKTGGCMTITVLDHDINFEATDEDQSDRLLKSEKAVEEKEKRELLEKDFVKAKEVAKSIGLSQ